MASYTSMAWWHRYYFMAITLMPIMNIGGMQLFKISSNDNAEKILPKSKEVSLRLIVIYSLLTFTCAYFINYLV